MSRVVRVDEEHLAPLTELIRTAWTPSASLESVREARLAAAAANPHGAGKDVPTFLFLQGERPLGHLTTIPVQLQINGSRQPAFWFKGYWVAPEQRNGPVGYFLLREALQQLDATTLSMVVQPAPRKLFGKLGLTDLGTLPNAIRVLRPGRVLRRLDLAAAGVGPSWATPLGRLAGLPGVAQGLGGALQLGLKGWTALQPSGRGVTALDPPTLDEGWLDALWGRCADTLQPAPVRDGAHLRARLTARPGVYQALTLEAEGRPAGFALVRRPREAGDPRLSGIRLATLADLVFPADRPDLGLRLLAGAEQAALRLGADAMLCSSSHRQLPGLLHRRGYVGLGGNVHFMIKPKGFSVQGQALQDWWLMRADGEADDGV